MSHFANERKRNIQRFKEFYIQNAERCDEAKIIATFSINTGLSAKKVRQYLEELKTAGML